LQKGINNKAPNKLKISKLRALFAVEGGLEPPRGG